MLYTSPVDDPRARRQGPSAPRRPAGRKRIRWALLGVIGALYALSIPWYRESGELPAVWWGLPDWVAVAIGCYAAVAVLNAVAWLLTDVSDTEAHDGERR
jgi:hypothetical protein